MSFRIEAGENIAVVGLNGAGKTTVIKLLCGLFSPTEGEILVNGQPISAYNRDEYYSIISAVFQTFRPLPLTIKQNITGTGNTVGTVDEKRYETAIRYADLDEYFSRLEKGGDTFLVKRAHESAAEPSGGETQKILLARAFYHDRPLLILDDPTAALDPIAESNMYERYAAFSAAKTSVFISHRLASTRFCNRIFYLENGTLAEAGSHAELMRRGGKYAELFEVQSKYYREHPDGEPENSAEGGKEDE
jgi:ATP-binding cassette subfamily B protein